MNLSKLHIALNILFFFNIHLLSQQIEWDHDEGFNDNLLYLHVYENYEFHPLWYCDWEEKYFSHSSIRINIGSVEVNDLMKNIRILINEKLNDYWWFQADLKYYDTHFINEEEEFSYLGFNVDIFNFLGLFLQFDPAFDKELINSRFGISIQNDERNQFIRLGLTYDEFLYDEKNNLGGKVLQAPRGILWQGRAKWNNFTVFTEGKFSSRFERAYPDSIKSPSMSYHEKGKNQFKLHGYYDTGSQSKLIFGLNYYDFNDAKEFRDSLRYYNLNNNFITGNLQYLFYLYDHYRFRVSGRYISQNSTTDGLKDYDYKREEIIPSVFWEYFFGSHIIELGVMQSFYRWDSQSAMQEYQLYEKNRIEKVKLGWTYTFRNKSILQISISHVFSIFGFGGGNIQYQLFF